MRTERADPDNPAGDEGSPSTYRVRVWTPPPSPNFSWFVDEWDVTEAEQVTDVIDWAGTVSNGNPFEVFYRWQDYHASRDGSLSERDRFARIYGKPAVDSGTVETVVFEAE